LFVVPGGLPQPGHGAGRDSNQQIADAGVKFALETPLPTVRFEDLALTSTRSADDMALDFKAHGIGRLLLLLVVRRQARIQLPKNQQRLKEVLERGA
jgi:hypothetical protein